MSLKQRKRVSPNKLKFFTSLVLGGAIMLLVFSLTNSLMGKVLGSAQKRYTKTCSLVLEGYSNAIRFYLDNYVTSLRSIYNPELFEKNNPDEIQKWIIQNIPFLSEDFCSVFYVDSDNTGYFSQGNIINLAGRSYLTDADFSLNDYYVSDVFESEYSEYPVFVIEVPFYDSDNTLKGILAASLKLSELEKIADSIKIGNDSTVYIMDRGGKFLVHPLKEYIGKLFYPKQEKYRNITSDVTAKSGKSIVETENERGEVVDLFSSKIKNCGWTLGVAFPKKIFWHLERRMNVMRLLILAVSIIALFVLLVIETLVSDFFYKHQLIDAVYDPLTKLWTRQKFEVEAAKLMRKNPKAIFMMIESDIKGFKFVNQNYSEDEADKMIYFCSKILNKMTRDYKGIIAHGYADNFYTFIKVKSVRDSMNAFKGRLYLINEQIKDFEIPFYPKFGITFCRPENHPSVTIKELIGQATFAKSTVKDNVLSQYAIYNSRHLSKINEERMIEQRMKEALEKQEFFVMYQPKILLSNEKIAGAEALVRWRSPEMGVVYPDKFIPLFERNGFIVKLDFYVYDKVFKFLDSQIKAGRPVVPISVNMSRNHNKPEKFMAEFMRIFRKYSVPSNLIQVEILERSVMDRETLCEITEALHKEGFTVAMDDFGSGESSLNMLTKIPVDVLKFDREFLMSSFNDKDEIGKKDAVFIRSLISLSKNLNKETVFEGVETQNQRDFLRSIECDQVQGYFYSKPLMEDNFVLFMNSRL